MFACLSRTPQMAALLLERGADLMAKDEKGRTALHLAAAAGRTKVVEFLLSRGAEIDARDSQGRTPLMLAASRGRKQTVKLLLDKGADPNAVDQEGNRPLELARGEEVMEMLFLAEGKAEKRSRRRP